MRHFISAALLFMVCATVAQTADLATTVSGEKSELMPDIYYSDTISDVKIQTLSELTKMIDLSPDALSQEVSTALPAVTFFSSKVSDYLPHSMLHQVCYLPCWACWCLGLLLLW